MKKKSLDRRAKMLCLNTNGAVVNASDHVNNVISSYMRLGPISGYFICSSALGATVDAS
jgi:hypothetical protein